MRYLDVRNFTKYQLTLAAIKDMCQEGKTKKDNGWDRGYKPISWMIELLVIWAAEHSEIKDDLKIFLNFLT